MILTHTTKHSQYVGTILSVFLKGINKGLSDRKKRYNLSSIKIYFIACLLFLANFKILLKLFVLFSIAIIINLFCMSSTTGGDKKTIKISNFISNFILISKQMQIFFCWNMCEIWYRTSQLLDYIKKSINKQTEFVWVCGNLVQKYQMLNKNY